MAAPAAAPGNHPSLWAEEQDEFERFKGKVERSYIFEERCSAAQTLKEEGNRSLQAGEFEEAEAKYEEGLYHVAFDEFQMADLMPDHRAQLSDVRIPLLLNSVLCDLRMNPPEQMRRLGRAERRCAEILALDPTNPKAKFRRAQLHQRAGETAEAKDMLRKLCDEHPNEASFRRELTLLRKSEKQELDQTSTFWTEAMRRQQQQQQQSTHHQRDDVERGQSTCDDDQPFIHAGRRTLAAARPPASSLTASDTGPLVPVFYALRGLAEVARMMWQWWADMLWGGRTPPLSSHTPEAP